MRYYKSIAYAECSMFCQCFRIQKELLKYIVQIQVAQHLVAFYNEIAFFGVFFIWNAQILSRLKWEEIFLHSRYTNGSSKYSEFLNRFENDNVIETNKYMNHEQKPSSIRILMFKTGHHLQRNFHRIVIGILFPEYAFHRVYGECSAQRIWVRQFSNGKSIFTILISEHCANCLSQLTIP